MLELGVNYIGIYKHLTEMADQGIKAVTIIQCLVKGHSIFCLDFIFSKNSFDNLYIIDIIAF